MEETKKNYSLKRVFKYIMCLFAFFLCSIVFSAVKIEAAPTISIPTEGEDLKRDDVGQLTEVIFYVGYDAYTVKSVQYYFVQGSKISSTISISNPTEPETSSVSGYYAFYKDQKAKELCEQKPFITNCTNVIIAYRAPISLSNTIGTSTTNPSFDMHVVASNKNFIFGGEAESAVTLSYDNKAPLVASYKLVDDYAIDKIGLDRLISFELKFNEYFYIITSKTPYISFNIGLSKKTAACEVEDSSNKLYCYYRVQNGDSGKISSAATFYSQAAIKDRYGNIATNNTSLNISNSLSVDGVKPYIKSIDAEPGTYSYNTPITVTLTFNEKISRIYGVTTLPAVPTIHIRFGGGEIRKNNCHIDATTNTELIYKCIPLDADGGAFEIVDIVDDEGYIDDAFNTLDLSKNTAKYFSNVIVNHGTPGKQNVAIKVNNCTYIYPNYYCSSGQKITVEFKFNMSIDANKTIENVTFKFGGVVASAALEAVSIDNTANVYAYSYTVRSKDNGIFSVEYNFHLFGSNGIDNKISGNETETRIYVDNSYPKIKEDYQIYVNGTVTTDSIFYTAPNAFLEFIFNIEESSEITFNGKEIYLLDANDNVINVCQDLCDIKSITATLNDKQLSVVINIADKAFSSGFKIKISKSVITDSFNNSLETDFESGYYVVDTNSPTFDVELYYPEYSTYNNVLVSGNRVNYKIVSSDNDLFDFCVVLPNDECTYNTFVKNNINEYVFDNNGSGIYSFNVRVRDKAFNISENTVNFDFNPIFGYSNGAQTTSLDHVISVDTSIFADSSTIKYAWFKEGQNLNFANTNVVNGQGQKISVTPFESNYNGNYRVCVNVNGTIVCSAYVGFDTRIDSFNVEISSEWVNGNLPTKIIFSDFSSIKCIVVGKNDSNLNCQKAGSSNVTIYRTYQAVSPLNKYIINENGMYYFYIEDAVGNNMILSKTITNVDNQAITIDVYNGEIGNYNTNLELESYKTIHKFLVTFDKDDNIGSAHKLYKYFFTTQNYSITTKDRFNAYYLNSNYRSEITNCNKSINITSPTVDAIYNLYIMAIDAAGNVSFKTISDIKVDSKGPTIKMYDSNNVESSGGSSSYIAVFDYNIVVQDFDSMLNLNKITYKWIDNSQTTILEKKYDNCNFDATTCKILGSDIEFGSGLFNPNSKYRFILTAVDNAGNTSEFISSEFMIDTTPPTIIVNVDEDAWYENGNIEVEVSKENNGTLSSVSYCLNNCLDDNNQYDINKFKILSISNNKKVKVTLNLILQEGENVLYVYASDVFGNYAYQTAIIKHDTEGVNISVNGLNEDGVVDLSGMKDNLHFDFTINDESSGIQKYCVSYDGDDATKTCFEVNGAKEISKSHTVDKNGVYSIEAIDIVGNKAIYNVSVIGIDTEPITFDLTSNVKLGQFVKGEVILTITNMRKFMVEDVADRIANIDYVALAYNYVIDEYSDLFSENVNKVYAKNSDSTLITSFGVTENKLYVVRIIDTAGNVSYNYIRIRCIDNDNPIINTNKYADGSDRIYVTTSSGNNLRIFVNDDGSRVYKYSNETIKVYFGADSLRDLTTGYNDYLGLKVCFEETDCVYNTYNVSNFLSEGYLINSAFQISAPYNFSGSIRYYIVDGAGNRSEEYLFEIEYLNEVSNVKVTLTDIDNNAINEVDKYSKIVANLEGTDINDIIYNNGIRYALVASTINLNNEFANRTGSIDAFLTNYGFAVISSTVVEITKTKVDANYYLWFYVKDLLNNYKLIKADELIRLDTIAPSFGDVSLSIDKIDSTNYDIIANNFVEGYTLLVDSDNDGRYEELVFANNKASFTASGFDSINFKLVDEAGNTCVESFDLNVTSQVYAKIYQDGNTRKANIIVYNLGSKIVTNFRYIVTNIDSNFEYDEDSINDDLITVCNGYEDTCKGTLTTSEKGKYTLDLTSFNKDKKVILYIYVNGTLIDLVVKNIMVDETTPLITISDSIPAEISTKNGEYYFEISVDEVNLTNLVNQKYILTTNSNLASFNAIYESCINSTNCARGVYDLDESLDGIIEINSNFSSFNRLTSGTYYLYVYIEDDFGNSKITRSGAIYIDNDIPLIEYSIKNAANIYQTYYPINKTVYIGSASKLRITDNYKVKYFEVYKENLLTARCYISDSNLDENCTRSTIGEIGLVFENGKAYYYLDNGNYKIVVYDVVDNMSEVSINIDGIDPIINLYKKNGETYESQVSSKKLYSDLTSLYISVDEVNFNYLTIDLKNTITGANTITASRYSYNSEIGVCLVNRETCLYGVKLVDLIVGNTVQYNQIVVKVFDLAGRVDTIEIDYDDSIPNIWTLGEGENIYIGGTLYKIEKGQIINVEIGVNKQLNMDSLLNKIVLDIDGMTYYEAKNTELFTIKILRNGTSFNNDICEFIGSYIIELNYIDLAGNRADSKTIYVNVLDNTAPEMDVLDKIENIELKEEVEVKGVLANDNYGLEINDNEEIVRAKNLTLSDATCQAFSINGSILDCNVNVIKITDIGGTIKYKFMVAGQYTFTYTITDIAQNSSTIVQTIVVRDTIGPVMNSSVDEKKSFDLYFGNRKNGSLNIENLILNYPYSFDKGDSENKQVEYVGLFALNNMGEKYKINDTYLISNENNIINYKFTKVGTYYLRFSSTDSSGNISIFEYEAKIFDKIAPIISGITDKQVLKMGLEEVFSVENVIRKFNITATDNYDSNIKIYYELNNSQDHSHEIILKASDSSNNLVSLTIFVDIEDYVAPIAGDLIINDSTNKTSIEFLIDGGSDNSNNWWHEYSIEGGNWIRINEDSKLELGSGLSKTIKVCIRAVDGAGNVSLSSSCKNILVDTKMPTINGIKDGEIVGGEVNVNVADDRLDTVEVWRNDILLDLSIINLPFKFSEAGSYQIIAKDAVGNTTITSFMINSSTHMDVINDINAEEYTITSVGFDQRFLVRVDISYDINGYPLISTNLNNVNVNPNDMIYILGIIPNTNSTFVMFNVNGMNLGNYAEGITLISGSDTFKNGISNEECFVRFNDYYYAYVLIKENDSKDTVSTVDGNAKGKDNRKVLSTILIIFGSAAALLIGYQLIKLRKRVRAA